MREIKFDAIYKPTGEHFTPKTIDFTNNTVTGNFDGEINDWCHFSLDGEFGDVILREYTGLKDKNGVEIYEGDIVKHEDFSIGCTVDLFVTGEVKMLEGAWTVDDYKKAEWLWSETAKNEILGNIYENPELLEVEANA